MKTAGVGPLTSIALGLMVSGGLQIFAGALVGCFCLILIGLFLRGAAAAATPASSRSSRYVQLSLRLGEPQAAR